MPLNSTATYQWYKDGTIISNATSYQYTVSSPGKYFCTVTVKTPRTVINQRTGKKVTLYTTKDYDTNLITVSEALAIQSQTGDGTINPNVGYYDLQVKVKGGTEPYTYEWTWLNMGTVGDNSSTYDALFAGSYRCKITDSNGNSVISDWVGINVSLLQITDQSSEYVYLSSANGTADIFVTAKGGKTPYTYKWTCNGKDINKNTSSITVSEIGEYNCVVTDAYGEVVKSSSKATINVMKPFEFTNYTKGGSSWSYYNNEYTLKVNVSGGTGRYVYNWQKKAGNNWYVVGCYNSEYTINHDDIKDNTYSTTSVKYGQVNWYDESNKKWIVTTNNYSYNTYRCVVKTVGNHGNGNVVSMLTTDDIEADKYLGSTTSYHDYWYF